VTTKKLATLRPDLLTEAQLSGLVVELARIGGWKRYHTFNSKRSTGGFPDWVFVKDGRLLFVELKAEKKQPRPDQREWLDALADVPNVEVYLWRPSDFDEIAHVLTGRKPTTREAAA
jgi:hypothetical protein